MIYRKWGLNFQEIWYSDAPPHDSVDIVVYFQAPATRKEGFWKLKQTLLVDLQKSEADLFNAVKKDTRSEIRRAERDGVRCEPLDEKDPIVMGQFFDFYDSFASSKGLERISRARIGLMRNRNELRLTVARDSSGSVLVYHAYRFAQNRARLLFSASCLPDVDDRQQRALIGKANRFLHWKDILLFSGETAHSYDFGGWYGGTEDHAKLRINKFKEEFGGVPVNEFDAVYGNSLFGRSALAIKRVLLRG